MLRKVFCILTVWTGLIFWILRTVMRTICNQTLIILNETMTGWPIEDEWGIHIEINYVHFFWLESFLVGWINWKIKTLSLHIDLIKQISLINHRNRMRCNAKLSSWEMTIRYLFYIKIYLLLISIHMLKKHKQNQRKSLKVKC